ncbi:MAG: hypothetical protein SF053_03085 [Bacteroidia bacterium]|nr:hypothetical protein [Bacteroidia bacterium]
MKMPRLNRNVLIVAMLIVASLVGFLLINYFSKPATPVDEALTVDNLTQEIRDLESTITEIDLINTVQEGEIRDLKSLMDEKYEQINALEQKIEQLEREGLADESTIRELREKLSNARVELLDRYKLEINQLVVDNSRLTQTLDSVHLSMSSQDSMIREYAYEVEKYKAALSDCGGRGQAAVVLPPETLPRIKAENVAFYSRQGNNQAPISGSRTPKIARSELQELQACIDFQGNSLVTSKRYVVYMVIDHSKTGTISNIEQNLSGVFPVGGQSKTYSRKAEIEYQQGKTSNLCMDYLPAKGSFAAGLYTVSFYCNGEVIGEKSFFVEAN